MFRLIISLVFLISHICSATINQNNCRLEGERCVNNHDCCSKLNCLTIEKIPRCVPLTINQRWKRQSDDLITPSYYDPRNQLYPYGINKAALPFEQPQHKHNSDGKTSEWDSCQYHEDCGEENCCYVHFRFRSLPKWFCRPNRNEHGEACEPLDKYRSLKNIPISKD